MPRVQEVGLHELPPAAETTGPSLISYAATGRRASPWWAALGIVVPLSGLLVGQARLVSRKYGESPAVAPVDVTVSPSGGGLAHETPVEMLAFGDSAMAGVGVDRVEDSLAVQLAQRVADSTGRAVHVVGYARSGARTIDVLTGQVPAALREPDVSVLVIGTNDVTGLTAPVTLARLSGALLDSLVSLGAPVVMSSLPEFRSMRLLPHPLMEAVLGYGAVVAAVQRQAAAKRPSVRYVNSVTTVGSEFIRDRGMISSDSFHPSAAGYGRIADTLAPAVLEVLAPCV